MKQLEERNPNVIHLIRHGRALRQTSATSITRGQAPRSLPRVHNLERSCGLVPMILLLILRGRLLIFEKHDLTLSSFIFGDTLVGKLLV
ncbi:hypothetical protein LIER_07630 [Lithospermum erythrorhizon]|uniref:Uncharacterized protein n=1 Tax=Lithospermum erythrorhizon TaxID=34254 RepID=A0AAV3PD72_LITER